MERRLALCGCFALVSFPCVVRVSDADSGFLRFLFFCWLGLFRSVAGHVDLGACSVHLLIKKRQKKLGQKSLKSHRF